MVFVPRGAPGEVGNPPSQRRATQSPAAKVAATKAPSSQTIQQRNLPWRSATMRSTSGDDMARAPLGAQGNSEQGPCREDATAGEADIVPPAGDSSIDRNRRASA